jgi:hypothetical protein
MVAVVGVDPSRTTPAGAANINVAPKTSGVTTPVTVNIPTTQMERNITALKNLTIVFM